MSGKGFKSERAWQIYDELEQLMKELSEHRYAEQAASGDVQKDEYYQEMEYKINSMRSVLYYGERTGEQVQTGSVDAIARYRQACEQLKPATTA